MASSIIDSPKNATFYIEPHAFTVADVMVSPKHWQGEIEAVYVQQGWLEINVQDEDYHLDMGQMAFISEGIVHSYTDKSSAAIIHVIKFRKEHLLSYYFPEDIKREISRLMGQLVVTQSSPLITKLVEELVSTNHGSYNTCFFIGKLLELTAVLLSHPTLITTERTVSSVNKARYLNLAVDYINQHFKEGVTLDMLANYLGFSTYYCSKYIKKKTGMTFVECVNAVRISHAEALLLEREESITEIAFDAGFSSTQTFNRVFKQIKNMSPTEYRKRCKVNY